MASDFVNTLSRATRTLVNRGSEGRLGFVKLGLEFSEKFGGGLDGSWLWVRVEQNTEVYLLFSSYKHNQV